MHLHSSLRDWVTVNVQEGWLRLRVLASGYQGCCSCGLRPFAGLCEAAGRMVLLAVIWAVSVTLQLSCTLQ